MGRQPFLTRLALGRSPFEPSTSPTQSDEFVQLDASRPDALPPTRSNPNHYTQLYDERGTPVNPRAHEHGRILRQAQNDVLSAVGVVERRSAPSDNLPGAYEDRLAQLEYEDSVGNAVALASTLSENACTWWIGSLKDRVLTFRFPQSLPFARIVATEYQLSGSAIIYAGFPARLLGQVCAQACVYAAYVVRPLDRLLFVTRASRRTKQFLQRWKNATRSCFRIFVEVLFYPFAYHSSLQRLGLLPARPLFPSWRALIPFSSASPLTPLSLHSSLPAPGVSDILTTVFSSPLVFVCLEHLAERWVYALIFEAIESSIIHPDNPDLSTPDDGAKTKASAILGLRQKSPSLVRNIINTSLVALGWGQLLSRSDDEEPDQRRDSNLSVTVELHQPADVGETQITNIRALPTPAVPSVPVNNNSREPHPPPSPTASEPSQNGEDPRIRITSREGIVEMEVRLPPQVLTSQTEVTGEVSSNHNEHNVTPTPVESLPQAFHRVTQLSTEPAQMIGAICKAQIVGFVTLPLKLVTFRLIASHYLRRTQVGVSYNWRPLYGINILTGLRNLDLREAGLLLSRVALCSALEVAVDLALWGGQCLVVTYLGRREFSWGAL